MSNAKNFLSNSEVCDRYGISRQTLWRRVRAGRFPAPTGRTGKGYSWERAVLDYFDRAIQEKVLKSVVIAAGNI